MKGKGILIADAHVKQRLWTNFPRIQGDAYEALKEVQKEVGRGFVISCGDLFDSNRPSSTDLEAVSTLMRNIDTLYYIRGNHDNIIPDIVSSLGTNIVHLDDTGTDIMGVVFYGIDWCNTKGDILYHLSNIDEASRQSPRKKVLIMHQSLDVFFMQHIITLEEIWNMLEASFDIFVGDIHVHQKVIKNNSTCTSPGPLVPQDIGQARHQQYMIKLLIENGNLTASDIPVKVRDYKFLEDPKELEEAVKVLIERNQYNLPPVLFIKAPQGYKVPREFVNREDIIVVANTAPQELHKEAQTAQSTGTLIDAVLEEIKETEPELADVMVPFAAKIYQSETPDDLMLGLLKKWEVIMI